MLKTENCCSAMSDDIGNSAQVQTPLLGSHLMQSQILTTLTLKWVQSGRWSFRKSPKNLSWIFNPFQKKFLRNIWHGKRVSYTIQRLYKQLLNNLMSWLCHYVKYFFVKFHLELKGSLKVTKTKISHNLFFNLQWFKTKFVFHMIKSSRSLE